MAKPYNIHERTFDFSRALVRLSRDIHGPASTTESLAGHLVNSGISIGMSLEGMNIKESKAEYIVKCTNSLAEARKTLYWLRIFEAESLAPKETLDRLMADCDQIISILSSLIRAASFNKEEN